MTATNQPGRRREARPDIPVTDDLLIEALRELPPWRSVGDSLDWDIAVIAYDVPTDTRTASTPIPAGLYTREVTGDGRTVTAHRWTNRTPLIERLDTVEHQHLLFTHLAHADPPFAAAHAAVIHAAAEHVLTLIEHDETMGGPLHGAAIRCWHDLNRPLGPHPYIDDLPTPDKIPDRLEEEFQTAVIDRTDTLLHQRGPLPAYDEADAVGRDGEASSSGEARM